MESEGFEEGGGLRMAVPSSFEKVEPVGFDQVVAAELINRAYTYPPRELTVIILEALKQIQCCC